jgi:hypothetical protein
MVSPYFIPLNEQIQFMAHLAAKSSGICELALKPLTVKELAKLIRQVLA